MLSRQDLNGAAAMFEALGCSVIRDRNEKKGNERNDEEWGVGGSY